MCKGCAQALGRAHSHSQVLALLAAATMSATFMVSNGFDSKENRCPGFSHCPLQVCCCDASCSYWCSSTTERLVQSYFYPL